MAQAARLNLRMQKELKLLLSDPPPGASFPSLSADSSSSSSSSGPSLSSIEALIEGPEGTVYAKGFFKLKIQIPDRYPFQPPVVTFATPIYHPNIDTGGRICLDILNLPPKGAWQPSLNISTILTSIGLLLSEPNPDDGLMHEASQEYKYNRQFFDQKARSMTEKYARIGLCEVAGAGQDSQTILNLRADLVEATGSHTSIQEGNQGLVGNQRSSGISRKLSLESSELDRERNVGKKVNEVPTENLFDRENEFKGWKQVSNGMPSEHIQSPKEMPRMSKKLSLDPSVLVHVRKEYEQMKWKQESNEMPHKQIPSPQKLTRMNKKLSLDPSVSLHVKKDNEQEIVKQKQESNEMPSEQIQSQNVLRRFSKKFSLDPLVSFHLKKDNEIKHLVSTREKSTSEKDCSTSLPLVQSGSDFQPKPDQGHESSNCKNASIKLEKLLQSLDSKKKMMDDDDKLHPAPRQSSTPKHSSGSQKDFHVSRAIRHQRKQPDNDLLNGDGNDLARKKHKKLGLSGRHLSTGMFLSHQRQGKSGKENWVPISSFPHADASKYHSGSSSLSVVSDRVHCQNGSTGKKCITSLEQRYPFKPLIQLSNSQIVNSQPEMEPLNPSVIPNAQHFCNYDKELNVKQDCSGSFDVGIKQQEASSPFDTDGVIVLDSEDSDGDVTKSTKSKLSLRRRRFPGKLKS